jgi:DNA-binding transcriptional MerR regulator
MSDLALQTPAYSQADVLEVTRLKPEVLQTWVNRRALDLATQNPGYGRRRLYSKLDVVKLAIMRRMADMKIALSMAREVADGAAEELLSRGEMDWNFYLTFRPDNATQKPFDVTIISSSNSPFISYSPMHGDPMHMLVHDLVYPLERGFILPRRDRELFQDYQSRKINPARREALAREGIHAEPAIIFPLGEIVNGTLAQLKAIDERLEKTVRDNVGAESGP